MQDIGWAIKELRDGKRVKRRLWPANVFLFFVPTSTVRVDSKPLLEAYSAGTEIDYHSHIDVKTASGYIMPWACTQVDLLATDWEVAIY